MNYIYIILVILVILIIYFILKPTDSKSCPSTYCPKSCEIPYGDTVLHGIDKNGSCNYDNLCSKKFPNCKECVNTSDYSNMKCKDTTKKYNEYKGKVQISDDQINNGEIALKIGNDGLVSCNQYCTDTDGVWADKTYDKCYFAYNTYANKLQDCAKQPGLLPDGKQLDCYCGNPSVIQKERPKPTPVT